MLTSLEHSLQHEDFLEFKQASNLRTQVDTVVFLHTWSSIAFVQLCHSLCHILCVLTDLTLIPPHSLSEPAIVCLTDCLNTVSDNVVATCVIDVNVYKHPQICKENDSKSPAVCVVRTRYNR